MNDDTISRQAAIDALEEPRKVSDTWTDEYAVGERVQWEKDVKALNSLPSAERRGRWKFDIDDEEWSWDVPFKCTQCGEWNGRETPYCPNCGSFNGKDNLNEKL